MPDYAKLYRRIFNSATDAINILQQAQQETENAYIESPEPNIQLLKHDDLSDGDNPEKD